MKYLLLLLLIPLNVFAGGSVSLTVPTQHPEIVGVPVGTLIRAEEHRRDEEVRRVNVNTAKPVSEEINLVPVEKKK